MTHPLSESEVQSEMDRGRRAHLAGQFAQARQIYEQVAARNPNETSPHVLLAELDVRDGRLVTAKSRLERMTVRHPDSLELRGALANLLEELGDAEAATAFYRHETQSRPDNGEGWVRLAGALQVSGQIEEAQHIFRALIERWPQSVAGYFGLAAIDPKLLSHDEVDRLRVLAVAKNASLDERVHAQFALGNINEALGDYDAAFAAFSEGNRLRKEHPDLTAGLPEWLRSLSSHSPAFTSVEQAERLLDGFIRETIRNFSFEYLQKFAGNGRRGASPVFIVGMPRSGSTLLEQILASHPDMQGLGETAALTRAFRSELTEVQRDSARAQSFYRLVGDAYLDALRELGWDGRRRAIDKMLGNYISVGIIHLALPDAVVIHSARDPVDTCLSCFRQLFGKRNEQSYDLAALGRQYVSYRQMIAHWDRVLPGRIVHVEHEKLLAQPEAAIRDLVAKCRLPWNDACLAFDRTKRTVRTASVAQVRKPISDAAVGRWRRYEKHLGPLFQALGPYAPS